MSTTGYAYATVDCSSLPNSVRSRSRTWSSCICCQMPKRLPFLKVAIHSGVGWEVMGQHFPLASSTLYIKYGIENLAKFDFDRMTKPFGCRYKRFQYFPLNITEIARVRFPFWIRNFRETSHVQCNYSTGYSIKSTQANPEAL